MERYTLTTVLQSSDVRFLLILWGHHLIYTSSNKQQRRNQPFAIIIACNRFADSKIEAALASCCSVCFYIVVQSAYLRNAAMAGWNSEKVPWNSTFSTALPKMRAEGLEKL